MFAQAQLSEGTQPRDGLPQLKSYLDRLEIGDVDIDLLKKLATFCILNPAAAPLSPSSADFAAPRYPKSTSPAEVWEKDRSFERMFKALVDFLEPSKVSVLLWPVKNSAKDV